MVTNLKIGQLNLDGARSLITEVPPVLGDKYGPNVNKAERLEIDPIDPHRVQK